MEVALDPSTWLGGVGALTHAGQAARAEGALTKGFIPSIRAGERTLAFGLGGKSVGPVVADALEGIGDVAGGINRGLRAIPGVAPVEDLLGRAGRDVRTGVRSLLSAEYGPIPNAEIQESYKTILRPGQKAADLAANERFLDLRGREQGLLEQGVDRGGLSRFLAEKYAGAEPHVHDLAFLATLTPAQRAEAHSLGEEIRRFGVADPIAAEQARGFGLGIGVIQQADI